ncbi:MAG TPA: phytoene desaturase [Anaerolineales bacterium]|nr:phytoene desaturase [Anaerolineales bacterium]
MNAKKIIIIGSGFGGLGAGIRLAARGHDVTLLEKADKAGGRGTVFEINGFKFDAGPTVITAPFLFDELFGLGGGKTSDYVQFVPLTPFYRIFDHQGKFFDYSDDMAFTLSEVAKWNPEDQAGYRAFINSTKPIFEKGFVELADQPFLHITDMLKVAPDLIKMQSYLSVYAYVSKFIKNEFLRRCFSFHPLLIGGNPFTAPSIYAMIHYLEREWGVHYAMGGTGALVQAMVRKFEELQGKLRLLADVQEISITDKRATGVVLRNGERLAADVVVSNADVGYTYQSLIPESKRKLWTNRKIESLGYSMSLFVIYFGTQKEYKHLGNLRHHNIILSERYRELINDIFHKKVVADDFSLYLHMPSQTDPSLAPAGCESFYVLSPVPHLASGIDWRKKAKPYRDLIMQFLEEHYLPDLQANIVAEHYIDPLHFRDNLNSPYGSAFSVEPVLTQSAWFRPHNQSEEFENLYFVGAGTHPGAGLPGVLSSAIIAERLIEGETKTPA